MIVIDELKMMYLGAEILFRMFLKRQINNRRQKLLAEAAAATPGTGTGTEAARYPSNAAGHVVAADVADVALLSIPFAN